MGAVVGAQFGPFGAAAGAGVMLVYSAITGQVPFQTSGGGGGGGYGGGPAASGEEEREAQMEDELEREVASGDALESEIDAELKRQEELLKQIESQEKAERYRGGGAAGCDQRREPRRARRPARRAEGPDRSRAAGGDLRRIPRDGGEGPVGQPARDRRS